MRTENLVNSHNKHDHGIVDKNFGTTSIAPKVVLVGNPNVGKSLFFNHLSGIYVDVSNFPGTTISISRAKYKDFDIIDTPGIYGVSSFNDEEKVARDVIISADVILNVVNALHLERDLFLTLQLIEMGKKVTILLNFTDELKKRKIKIDVPKLSQILGVDVIETSAVNKLGFDKLDDAIKNAREGNQNEDIHFLLHQLLDRVGSQAEALLVLEGDEYISERHDVKPGGSEERELLYIGRRNRVNEIVDQVEYEDSGKGQLFNLLGRLSINPFTGVPILALILVILYLFIGDLVSQRIVDYTENRLGKGEFEYHVKSFVGNYTSVDINVETFDDNENVIESREFKFENGIEKEPEKMKEFRDFSSKPNAVTDFHFDDPFVKMFFGEFGIITMTITYLVFLLFPLVVSFYLAMAVLEDSGYLPRLATMLDRTLNYFGLNGRAVIPIMLGFGCITMANITTRLLGSEREKTIVTAILQFVIPCSAQLAVITVLMSTAGFVPLLIYIGTIFSVLIILSTILNKMLPGQSTPLLIDLPTMRFPRFDNVFKKTLFRSYGFMKEAGFWFFVGAAGVGILEITGLLKMWQNLLAPLTIEWLQLPGEAANAFVMGMVRRDFGAAGLFGLSLEPMQITVALITITLFVPCIASFVVMLKERGIKEGMIIWFGTWVTAFTVGGIISQIFI